MRDMLIQKTVTDMDPCICYTGMCMAAQTQTHALVIQACVWLHRHRPMHCIGYTGMCMVAQKQTHALVVHAWVWLHRHGPMHWLYTHGYGCTDTAPFIGCTCMGMAVQTWTYVLITQAFV